MSNLEVKKISLEELNRLIEKNRADIAALQQKKKVAENKYHAEVEKLHKMKRSIRTHRLCTHGGMLGKFLIEPDMLTDDQVYDVLKLAFSYSGVQELLKKYLDENNLGNDETGS